MQYVRFTADPRIANGDFESVDYDLVTGAGVGIRADDHVRATDQPISEAEYTSERQVIIKANAAIPAPVEDVATPSLEDKVNALLAASPQVAASLGVATIEAQKV